MSVRLPLFFVALSFCDTLLTAPSWSPKSCKLLAVPTSQSFTTLSSLPLTARRASGEKHADRTLGTEWGEGSNGAPLGAPGKGRR